MFNRIANGVTTDTHPLYQVLMSRLADCIFQLNMEDLSKLKMAKQSQFKAEGRPNDTDNDVPRSITKKEVQLHCRRQTRGVDVTTRSIEGLLQEPSGDHGKDTMGVPLLDSKRIWGIWTLTKRHIKCIQDPVDISLYKVTGTLRKGGVQLNTYRCARGSTSIESFHCHLERVVPGTALLIISIKQSYFKKLGIYNYIYIHTLFLYNPDI